MSRKRSILIITSITLFLSFSAFVYGDRFFEIAKNMSIFSSLYKEVNNFYVDEVNPNTLMNTGINAMLKSLDPYTNYIPRRYFKRREADSIIINPGCPICSFTWHSEHSRRSLLAQLKIDFPTQSKLSGRNVAPWILSLNQSFNIWETRTLIKTSHIQRVSH